VQGTGADALDAPRVVELGIERVDRNVRIDAEDARVAGESGELGAVDLGGDGVDEVEATAHAAAVAAEERLLRARLIEDVEPALVAVEVGEESDEDARLGALRRGRERRHEAAALDGGDAQRCDHGNERDE
jgi:hypothetical protein